MATSREQVRFWHSQGLSGTEIGKKIGISRERVRQLVNILGLLPLTELRTIRTQTKARLQSEKIAIAHQRRLDLPFLEAARGRSATDCWPWPRKRAHHRLGYGRTTRHGEQLAHRIAWIRHTGAPVPIGMYVLHHCDNPPCVNPAHLFLGTQKDNIKDAIQKGRFRQHKTLSYYRHLRKS